MGPSPGLRRPTTKHVPDDLGRGRIRRAEGMDTGHRGKGNTETQEGEDSLHGSDNGATGRGRQ